MIEFVTLFLALTLGRQPVELAAAEMVSAIELRLDGEVIARKEEPPWRLEIDFGEALLPHELVAVAFDASGRRVGETRQWVNYSRGQAEARWALDPAAGWPPKKARLVWQSFNGKPPREVRARFDGNPIGLSPDWSADLGVYDPSSLHSLEAELFFRRGLEAQAGFSFGGGYGEAVSSALTAVPLRLPKGVQRPDVQEVVAWLRQRSGDPVQIHSLDEERFAVYLVRDRYLPRPLPVRAVDKPQRPAQDLRRLRRSMDLYFVDTIPKPFVAENLETALFTPYEVGNPYRSRGILYVVRRLAPIGPGRAKKPECCQMIYNAAAVAGKLAMQSGRRRAVLLLRDPTGEDRSSLQLQQVGRFLEELRVPFFQWRRDDGAPLSTVVHRLERSLERQLVVWLEGSHLPRDLELTSAAPKGTVFAGSGTAGLERP